jgi:hypothetical protein
MPLTKNKLSFIVSVKEKIHNVQYDALKTMNKRMIYRYWDTENGIFIRQRSTQKYFIDDTDNGQTAYGIS